jgi:hypothetical protein
MDRFISMIIMVHCDLSPESRDCRQRTSQWEPYMEFVLVNGRIPRTESFCALCCEPIGESYLRELTTRLSYCDHTCYVGHCELAVSILKERARAS